MPAYVVYPDGSYTEVKNLGWLLRHWKEVVGFRVTKHPTPQSSPPWDAMLYADLIDGREYVTDFASADMLMDFLHRPVFYSLPVDWFGDKIILSSEYRKKYS